ncbi:hypothetical protein C8R47DRAFT_978275, partial [Mycena vitilis]
YSYIDFGLSLYFPNGKDTAFQLGTRRNFLTIPELSQTVPYNPFKVDIFQLGLTIQNIIDACSAYPDLKNFRPVADSLTAINPDDRPTPAEALEQAVNSLFRPCVPNFFGGYPLTGSRL